MHVYLISKVLSVKAFCRPCRVCLYKKPFMYYVAKRFCYKKFFISYSHQIQPFYLTNYVRPRISCIIDHYGFKFSEYTMLHPLIHCTFLFSRSFQTCIFGPAYLKKHRYILHIYCFLPVSFSFTLFFLLTTSSPSYGRVFLHLWCEDSGDLLKVIGAPIPLSTSELFMCFHSGLS